MPLESKRRQSTLNNTDWNVSCYCNSKLPKTYTWSGIFILKDGRYTFTFFLFFLPDTLCGCIGSLGMSECEEMKSLTGSQETVLFNDLLDVSLSLGFSRQNIRRKMKRRMENQHLVLWRGPCSTQRQARELISGPDLATRARLLPLNRTQSRVVIVLLTGHNTLRRHLYVMGLGNNPTCRKCGTEEETSVPHFVWVWGLGFTQAYKSGFLLFWPWGYQETTYRGHLELCFSTKHGAQRARKNSNPNTIQIQTERCNICTCLTVKCKVIHMHTL
jgi:hypothetical protein